MACGKAFVQVTLNMKTWTLGEFVQKVLKQAVGMNEPTIIFGDSEIYAEGSGLDAEEVAMFRNNLTKKLGDCPGCIEPGSIVNVSDFSQSIEFSIMFAHADKIDKPEGFTLTGDKPAVKAAGSANENAKIQAVEQDAKRAKITTAEDDDDDVVVIDDDEDAL